MYSVVLKCYEYFRLDRYEIFDAFTVKHYKINEKGMA